ncbi:GNAT family N-acetyltransferase [Pseudonocardia sp. TRM90224]|uniref:GNAT family N-acetyltransferase n=1 Tax=Pseudonocardia sp. TRM90224 TaxID=2812678 RepID=UPI001E2D8889|nr:GNAT family N-acetyltransferase [Pseudonocardia sp. TRM90224]
MTDEDRIHRTVREWAHETQVRPDPDGTLRWPLTSTGLELVAETSRLSATGHHVLADVRVEYGPADGDRAPAGPLTAPLLAALLAAEVAYRGGGRAEWDPAAASAALVAAAATDEGAPFVTADGGSALAESLQGRSPAEIRSWFAEWAGSVLLPAVRRFDAEPVDETTEAAAARLSDGCLRRRVIGVVGALGAAGLADEAELVADLRGLLAPLAEDSALVRTWLEASVLPSRAGLITGLRGRDEVFGPTGAYIETVNPLRTAAPSEVHAGVPGPVLPELGEGWDLRLVDPDSSDVDMVTRWMAFPHVERGWRQAWPREQWAAELAAQRAGNATIPCIASFHGVPTAYIELYRAVRSPLADRYEAWSHDIGIHIAIAEIGTIGKGAGTWLVRELGSGTFAADPGCRRIVGEPNVHNLATLRLVEKVGYRLPREIPYPHKNAALIIRTP